MPLRQRAAGIVVVDVADPPRFLILRAFANWDFPKGRLEPGETEMQAALRETREEAGITALSFPWGEVWTETGPYARNKFARYYLARCSDTRVTLSVNPELGRPEHHEYRWVGAGAAAALLPERLQPVLRWALERLAQQ